MSMELLQFSAEVRADEEAAYGKEPGFLDHIRANAGRALADKIMRDASLHRVYRMDDDSPWGGRVRHVWRIGVQTDLSELEAREKQMKEARAEGRADAVDIIGRAVRRFEQTSGGCKWVIMDALRSAAEEISRASR